MLLKRSRSGKSSNRLLSIIHEPESVRLQKDIEKITQRLESEKRESNFLEEQISVINHEISLLKQKETEDEKIVKKNKFLKNNLQGLEKQLEFEMTQLNEAIASNRKIRKTIDEYRLEKISYKRSLACLQNDLKDFSTQAELKNSEYRKGEDQDQEQKKKINIIRCKSALERHSYGKKISHLSSRLQEDKKERSKIFKIMESEMKQNINRPIEGIEVSKILKKILEKWSSKMKDKKRDLDDYLRYIKVVEDAFYQIKQATGIGKIEEIVVAFIKAQERNHEIYSYMNELDAEIDRLEENLKFTQEKIAFMEVLKETGEKSVEEVRENLEKTMKKTLGKTEVKMERIKMYREGIVSCFPKIGMIVESFRALRFTPQLNKKFEDSCLQDFTEENIMKSLGYIEEYINYMKILLAFSLKCENPISGHNPLYSLASQFEASKALDLKELLDDKELFDDRETDELKYSAPEKDFQTKARSILNKYL